MQEATEPSAQRVLSLNSLYREVIEAETKSNGLYTVIRTLPNQTCRLRYETSIAKLTNKMYDAEKDLVASLRNRNNRISSLLQIIH